MQMEGRLCAHAECHGHDQMSCNRDKVRIKSQNWQAGDWLEVGDGGESVKDESPWFLVEATGWVVEPFTEVGNAGRADWREMINSV